MDKGKLIVMEGACDGIGKTTQFELLLKKFKDSGVSVTSHHFPSYETSEANSVTKYLNGDFGEPKDLSPYFINSLYAHDRAVTWYRSLKKEFDSGKTILLDRYTTSSLIYQSALIESKEEKESFLEYVIDFEYNKLGIKKPDKVIFLYAPFDMVSELRQKRNKKENLKEDIHESNLEFMKKVYENALFVAEYLNWDVIRCNIDNEMRSIEDIHEEICYLLNDCKNYSSVL